MADRSVTFVFLFVLAVLFTLLMNAQHFLTGNIASAIFALGMLMIVAAAIKTAL